MSRATVADTEQSGFVRVEPDKLLETIGRFLLMKQTKEDRDGRDMLAADKLPEGNSYCMSCQKPVFVVPEKDVEKPTPAFCENCHWLSEAGVPLDFPTEAA